MDWLTWQAIRDLADVEVAKDGAGVRYVTPLRQRSYIRHLGRSRAVLADRPVTPGSVVFARDAWRAPWRTALRAIDQPCVLVTVFNDAHVQAHATTALLDGTSIQHWFAVQVQAVHPKVTPMPIGVDGRDLAALTNAPRLAWADRDIGCLANFQPRNAERKALLRHCRDQAWMTTTDWGTTAPMTQAEYYALLGRSRFVLSPPGRGWDCYRTYEAIAMGVVPIVRQADGIDRVVDGLPVLKVNDWSEVTPHLERPAGTVERLTASYWRDQIRAAQERTYGTNQSGEA